MLAANYQFEAIGTQWSIETTQPLSSEIRTALTKCIDDFSQVYSRFDQNSLVYNASRAPGESHFFPASIVPLLATYDSLYRLTDGRVNPLVGAGLENLGYDANYSLTVKNAPRPAPALSTLGVRGTEVILNEPALLDIGAIGKGYLIDTLSEIVASEHDEFVIDGSGDIRAHTVTAQRIGLEDPRDASRVLGHITLTKGSLCASATNRRAWGDGLHHIIDATTGLPAKTEVLATWAVAETALEADALTTGLFFATPQALAAEFTEFQYAILYKDGSMQHNVEATGEIYS